MNLFQSIQNRDNINYLCFKHYLVFSSKYSTRFMRQSSLFTLSTNISPVPKNNWITKKFSVYLNTESNCKLRSYF